MKNTMKIKSLLSFFVPAAMMSLMVASCSDYDNGYDTNAIKFNEEFRKAYGDIDPEQDWNLAERGTVTVSTMKESEVKIYALVGDEYCIVGDYEGVNGTRMLGFDMVEGTTQIMVTDGVTAQQTVPGGVVAFDGNTRFIVHEGTTDGVTVDRFDGTTPINGVPYPAQKTPSDAEISLVLNRVPEHGANLNNVTNNFSYISTGSFVIYPYYWNTSSNNTIGVYYTDNSGQYHEVDIYTLNGEDSWYSENYGFTDNNNDGYRDGQNITTFDYNAQNKKYGNGTYEYYKRPNDWYIEGNGNMNQGVDDAIYPYLHKNGWSVEHQRNEPSGLVPPFIEYYKSDGAIGTVTIKKDISHTFQANRSYLVEVKARLMNENGEITNDNMGKITFEANESSVIMTNNTASTTVKWHDSQGNIDKGVLYADMNGRKTMWVKCTSDGNGKIQLRFKLEGVGCNWFAFNDVKVYDYYDMSTDYKGGTNNFYYSSERGKGIRVDIQEGTKFGMYLKKTDNNGGNTSPYTFYSESWKNDYKIVGSGVEVVNGENVQRNGTNPCYASTFKMPGEDGDKMFLGFEDWPNVYENSDFDLNDVVFAFDGCKPIIINEDPKAATWMLVCEDLGGSFDVDYNDVIFKVEHISGKTEAKVTALAAGGTLASYIFFLDPLNGNNEQCLGEIHQLLGATPQNSGSYSPINADHDGNRPEGRTVTINVDRDWTMAFYSTETWGTGTGYSNVNMGGFEVRTLNKGSEPLTGQITIGNSAFTGASRIQPPGDTGMAPYILCLPYTYTRYHMNYQTPQPNKKTEYVWAWPAELVTICNNLGEGPYPKFKDWVSDKSKNDWYMYKNTSYNYSVATVKDIYHVSDMSSAEQAEHIYNGGNENGNNNNVNYNNDGIYRVNGDEVCRFTFQSGGTTYALAYDENQSENGSLVIKELDNNDPDQIWRIETTTQGNSQYGYLYNYGADQRIDVNYSSSTTNWKAKWTESTSLSDRGGRFKFVVSGNGYYIYLRYWEKNDADGTPHYLGADNIGDGACVWMNKTVSENKAILWNKTSASEPTSTGGNGDWTTLTSLGNANNNGSGSYSIATLLDICGNASSIELTVEGDSWGSITLIAMNGDAIAWNDASHTLSSSTTTITISKNTLQSWQNEHYDKVLMQNPSSSTKARPI